MGGAAGPKRTFAANGEGLPVAAALLNGTELDRAVFSNEDVLFALSELRGVPGLTLTAGAAGQPVTVVTGGRSFALSAESLVADDPAAPAETWLSANELAAALDAKLSFDPDRNVVALAWA